MPMIGRGENTSLSNFRIIDDLSNEFDGTKTIFALKELGKLVMVHSIGATFISVNSILLTPKTDYSLDSDSQHIIFTKPPQIGDSFSGRLVETSGIVVPDNSITPEKLSSNVYRPEKQSIDIPVGNTKKTFALNEVIEDVADISVYVDGLYQRPGSNYKIMGATITFDEIPPVGTEIDILYNIARTGGKITEVNDGNLSNSKIKDGLNDLRTCVEVLEERTVNKGGGIQWIFNETMAVYQQCASGSAGSDNCASATGKCCHWTVPANVCCVIFEIWGGGGGGAGMTCCNCCSFTVPGGGGNYAIKAIQTKPGCQYTVCSGGTYPCCKTHSCTSGPGCPSYVVGYNLNNFCVLGGCMGIMCNGEAWAPCRSIQPCANNPDDTGGCTSFGADFSISGTTGMGSSASGCHCYTHTQHAGTAPLIGLSGAIRGIESWCNCACFIIGYASGGLGGVSTYCDNYAKCCAAGNMGGPGLARITFF